MDYLYGTPLAVYGIQRPSNNSYWDDVAHLPAFRDYHRVHGADGFLMNGGRATWEFREYLRRMLDVPKEDNKQTKPLIVDGKLLDRDFLENALAEGDLLGFY